MIRNLLWPATQNADPFPDHPINCSNLAPRRAGYCTRNATLTVDLYHIAALHNNIIAV